MNINLLNPKAQIALMNSRGGKKLSNLQNPSSIFHQLHQSTTSSPVTKAPGTSFATYLQQNPKERDLEAQVRSIVTDYVNAVQQPLLKGLINIENENSIMGDVAAEHLGKQLATSSGFLGDVVDGLVKAVMKNINQRR